MKISNREIRIKKNYYKRKESNNYGKNKFKRNSNGKKPSWNKKCKKQV